MSGAAAGPAKRVCVFTATRAEFGLLLPVIRALRAQAGIDARVLASGTHLDSPAGEGTRWEIEAAGVAIDEAVALAPRSDSRADVARAMGEATPGLVDALGRLAPDLLLVLGDRYELLPVASVATVLGIPIAHIAGGDVTQGAFDDRIRGAVTQLSELHFVTHAQARDRLIGGGIAAARVILSGSPAMDSILAEPARSRAEIAADLGVELGKRNLLVTFHPVTGHADEGAAELAELLGALDRLAARWGDALGIWFTAPNADPGAIGMRHRIEEAVRRWPRARLFESLGASRFRALTRACELSLGNSSSGIYEAPALGTAALDVGERQRGRARPPEVVHVDARAAEIEAAVERLLVAPRPAPSRFFGQGDAASMIARGIADYLA